MKSIDDLAVEGRRVLVRADLNVPLDGGRVADEGRIRATLPTLTALTSRGARVIVCAHLGRPGGRTDLRYSLAPVAARLAELLGQEVSFPGDIVGHPARTAIAVMRPGDLVMLEKEVASREADLASLQAKKRRLADLTALSTITVTFLGPAAPATPTPLFAARPPRAPNSGVYCPDNRLSYWVVSSPMRYYRSFGDSRES